MTDKMKIGENLLRLCVLTVFVLTIIIKCGTGQKEIGKPIHEVQKTKEVPKENKLCWFILNPPENTDDYIFGTGSGNSSSSADENARASVSKYFQNFLTTRYREYFESHQIDDREMYNEYIDNVIIELSQLQIPGTKIEERCTSNDTFFSLAKINRSVFDSKQQELKNKIIDYINEAKHQNNPGKKLRNLFFAASILPQSIYPFDIDNIMAVVYVQNQISNILDSVESSYNIIKNHELSGERQIIIQLLFNNKPLISIPVLFETTSLKCDSNGYYYLDYDEICDGNPFYLKWKIDHNSLSYPELNKYEVKDAVSLIKNLSGKNFNIYIVPPVDLKSRIIVNYSIDDETASNNRIEGGIKKTLLENEIKIALYNDDANMCVKADVDVFFSSRNEYLGFCYKANATVTITGDGMERKVISLNDIESEESTKSFNENKEIAAENSLKSMISLIRKELACYLKNLTDNIFLNN